MPKIMEPQIGQKTFVWPLLCFAALLDVELPRPRNSALERPRDGIVRRQRGSSHRGAAA